MLLETGSRDQSGLSSQQWLRAYFNAYLIPLVHCFYAHKLVFMPHGENLILKLKNSVPVGAYMKDIGDDVSLETCVAAALRRGVISSEEAEQHQQIGRASCRERC